MELQTLIDEYGSQGLGPLLYQELLRTVRSVVVGRGYPTSYSPMGVWDEGAYSALTHDWAVDKLWKRGHLQHLLTINRDLRGFRKGLELSFRQYLISKKKRTALDNLFSRANSVLETDGRFRCFVDCARKVFRFWGLGEWQNPTPYQGSDEVLISAGLRLTDFEVIHYRGDAKKLSPVISNGDLAEFIAGLLREVRLLLSLEQMVVVFKYRFDLLEAGDVSLDEPIGIDRDGKPATIADTIGAGVTPESEALVDEAAHAVLRAMSSRQQRVLLECARSGATLISVAALVGCSKSTVDNEFHRAWELVRQNSEDAEEAKAVFSRILELLNT